MTITHEQTVEQRYQVLDEIEHVKKRASMYLGSPISSEAVVDVLDPLTGKFSPKQLNIIPALIKIYDEILTNSCDEARRNPGVMTAIKVSIDQLTGEISVEDDGSGIPVVKHAERGEYIPEMIFSNLRAGSNFNDSQDQDIGGTNGVGSTLCAIMSDYFLVETADGKNAFRQEYTNGLREKSEPKVFPSTRHYTRITFRPNYKYFDLAGLDSDHYDAIVKRTYDAAANNLTVRFFINSKDIEIKSFSDFIGHYVDNAITDSSQDGKWCLGVSHSRDGFKHVSFVNGVNTYMGGTHVDYVVNQIATALREHISKKHKIDVRPSEIKNHLHLFLSARINRPRFSSQTKENMVSPVSSWKSSYTIPDAVITQIIKNTDIVSYIVDWMTAKKEADDQAELRKLNTADRKNDYRLIPKLHDATTTVRSNAILFLAEGDSALTPLLGGRFPETMGVFPMRGRPINVCSYPLTTIKNNAEFDAIRRIIGLKYGQPADLQKLNFGKIVVASDADEYGKSICGLTINMFHRFWPELLQAGIVYRLITPVIVTTSSTKSLCREFFSIEEFDAWAAENEGKKYTYRFIKGLGSNNSKAMREYLSNPDRYMIRFDFDPSRDNSTLDLCFMQGKTEKGEKYTDLRKNWLDLEETPALTEEE